MNQKGQSLIFLLVGILVIAAISGAFYLGRSTTPKPSPTPATTSQTQNLSQMTGKDREYLTYQYNVVHIGKPVFRVEIPKDWSAYSTGFNLSSNQHQLNNVSLGKSQNEIEPGVISDITPLVVITFTKEPTLVNVDPGKWSLDDQLDILRMSNSVSGSNEIPFKWSDTKVGGLPAKKTVGLSAKGNFITVMLIKDNTLFAFSTEQLTDKDSWIPIFEHILSSFELIDTQFIP